MAHATPGQTPFFEDYARKVKFYFNKPERRSPGRVVAIKILVFELMPLDNPFEGKTIVAK